jgi:hypothetical protein
MTETEELLIKFNVDSRNYRLRNYYEADNIWRSLRIERDENRHSAFLSWLLSKDYALEGSPFYKFLNLIIHRSKSDAADFKEFKRSVLLGKFAINKAFLRPEMVISTLSKIRFTDRLDIYASCEITGVGDFSHLELFIENKIDSSEGNSKVAGRIDNPSYYEESYREKKQTERYYYACSKEDPRLRKDPFDYDHTIQLFVFLSAKGQEAADEHFVSITYQDLVDFLFEPYLVHDGIDSHTSMCIAEYLRILGNPINDITIMATTSEEKELLMDFYTRNEDLFRRALEVKRDSADTEEEAENYKSMLDSMRKSKVHRFFTINDEDTKYKMYEVVAEFVKFLLNKGVNFDDIERIIKDYTKENTTCHISPERANVKRHEKCFESKSDNGQSFFVTKEWGKGSKGRNFDGFQEGIERDYKSEFRVKEI